MAYTDSQRVCWQGRFLSCALLDPLLDAPRLWRASSSLLCPPLGLHPSLCTESSINMLALVCASDARVSCMSLRSPLATAQVVAGSVLVSRPRAHWLLEHDSASHSSPAPFDVDRVAVMRQVVLHLPRQVLRSVHIRRSKLGNLDMLIAV